MVNKKGLVEAIRLAIGLAGRELTVEQTETLIMKLGVEIAQERGIFSK